MAVGSIIDWFLFPLVPLIYVHFSFRSSSFIGSREIIDNQLWIALHFDYEIKVLLMHSIDVCCMFIDKFLLQNAVQSCVKFVD